MHAGAVVRASAKRQSRVRPAALVVAALIGTWVGHSLEYLRVWGSARFPDAMARSAHAYMGPLGVILLALAVTTSVGALRALRRLDRRVTILRRSRWAARNAGDDWLPRSTGEVDFPAFVAALWLVQLALYVVQENLEARAFGMTAPGWGAISGVHALAPIVHLVVATLAAAVVWCFRHRVAALVAEVRRAQRRLARCQRLPAFVGTPSVPSWTPLQRWGSQLWARPPPVFALR